jgi:hypothetical protein
MIRFAGCLRSMQHSPAGIEPLLCLRHRIWFGHQVIRIFIFLDSMTQASIFVRFVSFGIIATNKGSTITATAAACAVWGARTSAPAHASPALQSSSHAVVLSFVHCDECGHCISLQSMNDGQHKHRPGRSSCCLFELSSVLTDFRLSLKHDCPCCLEVFWLKVQQL